MISPSNVEAILSRPEGQALRKHIKEELAPLLTHEGIDCTDKETATIELRARQLAYQHLFAVLEPFMDAKKVVKSDPENTKSKYGLV